MFPLLFGKLERGLDKLRKVQTKCCPNILIDNVIVYKIFRILFLPTFLSRYFKVIYDGAQPHNSKISCMEIISLTSDVISKFFKFFINSMKRMSHVVGPQVPKLFISSTQQSVLLLAVWVVCVVGSSSGLSKFNFMSNCQLSSGSTSSSSIDWC